MTDSRLSNTHTELLNTLGVESIADGTSFGVLNHSRIRGQIKSTSKTLGTASGFFVHAGLHTADKFLSGGQQRLDLSRDSIASQHAVDFSPEWIRQHVSLLILENNWMDLHGSDLQGFGIALRYHMGSSAASTSETDDFLHFIVGPKHLRIRQLAFRTL